MRRGNGGAGTGGRIAAWETVTTERGDRVDAMRPIEAAVACERCRVRYVAPDTGLMVSVGGATAAGGRVR